MHPDSEQQVQRLLEELEQEKHAVRRLTLAVAEALINAAEAKDVYLRGHSQRVAELGASIAAELGLDDATIEDIRLAGRLHDIGLIGIRESVLNKPAALTPEEFEHVKDHVRIGMEILLPLKHLGRVLDYVQDHHEHFDGSGYPRGLAGEAISLGGRILAAADSFDAVTSPRAYRAAMSRPEALARLQQGAGTTLDPAIYGTLCTVVLQGKSLVFIDTAR